MALPLAQIDAIVREVMEDDLADDWMAMLKPSLRLIPTDQASTPVLAGGPGLLAAGQEHPKWDDIPLDFLCRIDCAAVAASLPGSPLPSTGTMTVWIDRHLGQRRPGMEMVGLDQPHLRPAWRLLHTDDDVEPVPAAGDTDPVGLAVVPEWTWPRVHASPDPFADLRAEMDLPTVLSDVESELEERGWNEGSLSSYHGICHRIGGWPQLLASGSVAALSEVGVVDDTGRLAHGSPDAEVAEEGAWKRHRLTLRLASDDHLDWMWWGDGALEFMGPVNGDATDVWLHASRQ